MELLEKLTQAERRALRPVAQDRDERVALALDFPRDDLAPWRTLFAARPALAALAFLATPGARPRFPIRAGAGAGGVLARDEPRRVERDDIAKRVGFSRVVSVADSERAPV